MNALDESPLISSLLNQARVYWDSARPLFLISSLVLLPTSVHCCPFRGQGSTPKKTFSRDADLKLSRVLLEIDRDHKLSAQNHRFLLKQIDSQNLYERQAAVLALVAAVGLKFSSKAELLKVIEGKANHAMPSESTFYGQEYYMAATGRNGRAARDLYEAMDLIEKKNKPRYRLDSEERGFIVKALHDPNADNQAIAGWVILRKENLEHQSLQWLVRTIREQASASKISVSIYWQFLLRQINLRNPQS